MKLESLKSSKFEMLRANEIQNLLAISGGSTSLNTEIKDHCFQDKWAAGETECIANTDTKQWGDVYYFYNNQWVLDC